MAWRKEEKQRKSLQVFMDEVLDNWDASKEDLLATDDDDNPDYDGEIHGRNTSNSYTSDSEVSEGPWKKTRARKSTQKINNDDRVMTKKMAKH